jgi:hypothetical protein
LSMCLLKKKNNTKKVRTKKRKIEKF